MATFQMTTLPFPDLDRLVLRDLCLQHVKLLPGEGIKNGCHQAFKVYVSQFLKDNGILGLPLQPLRGNQFNILFANAGHVYFLRHKMTEYLKKTNSMNGLLKSVLKDLEVPFFIAGCKAMCLISKLITTPLCRH